MRVMVVILLMHALFLSCNRDSRVEEKVLNADKLYVLPYPVGKAYTCLQGFSGSSSHTGTFTYSVDFGMSIGTLVTAARNGRVVYVVESYADDDQIAGHENVVIVMHEDSTYARYVHLTRGGALVQVNQSVAIGDSVCLSGNSGSTGPPHLHFDVTKTFGGRSDQTIPFDFRNTSLHPVGMESGVAYTAFPY